MYVCRSPNAKLPLRSFPIRVYILGRPDFFFFRQENPDLAAGLTKPTAKSGNQLVNCMLGAWDVTKEI